VSNRRKLPPPPPDDAGGLERFPCGCRMGVVGDAFVMEPCSGRCPYFRYAMAQSRRLGRPVSLVDMRDQGAGDPGSPAGGVI
jgi:hypothetical protein